MKRLVLIGGGHSHLEVLRRLAAQPRDFDSVLLTPDRHAFYSGMIPGVIAGDYAIEECRVDLAAPAGRALASWRGHAFQGRWVWFWKDWLDRRFLRRYARGAPGMAPEQGAKV